MIIIKTNYLKVKSNKTVFTKQVMIDFFIFIAPEVIQKSTKKEFGTQKVVKNKNGEFSEK